MPKPNPNQMQGAPVPRVQMMDASTIQRHERMQRLFVILMGGLWLLAFATGCSRNTKNCSAYDGVDLQAPVKVECSAPAAH